MAGDIDMWLRISCLRSNNFLCNPEVLTSYRRHGNQLTNDWEKMLHGIRKVKKKAELLNPDLPKRIISNARSNEYRYFAFIAYENTDLKDALKLLGKSVIFRPLYIFRDSRPWMLFAAIASKAILPKSLHEMLYRLALKLKR